MARMHYAAFPLLILCYTVTVEKFSDRKKTRLIFMNYESKFCDLNNVITLYCQNIRHTLTVIARLVSCCLPACLLKATL